jgi:hypothetical protein
MSENESKFTPKIRLQFKADGYNADGYLTSCPALRLTCSTIMLEQNTT